VPWQVSPRVLGEMLADKDKSKAATNPHSAHFDVAEASS
jgi:predicted 3-demethylubiquinone-9 3-methyltransferase (glyoxalase superfamily)